MRKVKIGINVRFNEREKAENPGLGFYGVIDVEVYTGDLDNDRSEMEYDDADSLEAAVEQARGLEAETDIDDGTDPKRFSQEEAEASGEDTPIREDFLHAPNRPGAVLVGENRRLYTLGRMLEEDCPDNDCRVYLNIFHMAQEADAALGVLDGYAAQVMARDLRRSLSELWDMYLTNDAIFRYRRGRSGKHEFFYEADIRNEASIKLLHKFDNDYEIIEHRPKRLTTDSGKELELQGHIIKEKIS